MRQQQYIRSLEEAYETYGKDNLIPISFIKQQIFYAKHGCQPRFIWEKEDCQGKLVAWYLKCETEAVHRLWNETKPK